MKIELKNDIDGTILDIGGGGEGIVCPYVAELDIALGEASVHVSYGIVKNGSQSSAEIIRMAEGCGSVLEAAHCDDGQFFLRFVKEVGAGDK